MDKAELRLQMLNQRNTLSAQEILDGSKALCQLLIQLPVYKKSRVILSYMPYGKEANVMPINQRILEDGKTLLIPRVKNATEMDAVPIDALDSGLVEGAYGIREPDPGLKAISPKDIELVLVPGLAFDKKGNRLGHGKGYYDRFLEQCSPQAFFIGIAHAFQVFDTIPSEVYDKKVHGLLTEKEFILL
jgi:5-formyltetrahydrofolate cyclo-ligase